METDWIGPYTIKTMCGKNLVQLERNGSVLKNKVSTVQLKPYLQREDTTVVDADTHQLDSSTSPVHTKHSESVLVVSRKHNPKHVYGESNLEIAHSK